MSIEVGKLIFDLEKLGDKEATNRLVADLWFLEEGGFVPATEIGGKSRFGWAEMISEYVGNLPDNTLLATLHDWKGILTQPPSGWRELVEGLSSRRRKALSQILGVLINRWGGGQINLGNVRGRYPSDFGEVPGIGRNYAELAALLFKRKEEEGV